MAIVIFNPEVFREIYPQFKEISDIQLNNFFDNACLILDNSDNSRVPFEPSAGVKDREQLLILLTAHITSLSFKQVAGAITSATEGSTSASFYIPQQRGADWFFQTQYGYSYWQLSSQYRHGGILVNDKKTHF